MKLAIMQPYIFPYIGYFQLINAVDKFVILDDVNFIMRGWVNRNKILVNDKEYLFSIPVKKASQNKLILECELAEGNWKSKFLKTIEYSYKEAPFYKDCYEIVASVISSSEHNLSKWIAFQLRMICNYLDINTIIIESSGQYSNRNVKGQDKIIDICKKENADVYYNTIGGKELYNSEIFKKNKIELHFLNTQIVEYPQFNFEFIPSLSIIDLMMFNDKQKISDFLKAFELL